MRMRCAGANRAPRAPGPAERPGKVSYRRDNDPPAWRSEIPTPAKVRCEGVHPGLDMVYYGHASALEHDFIVAPGADPKASALSSECVAGVEITARGASALRTPGGGEPPAHALALPVGEGVRQESAGGFVPRGPEARDARVDQIGRAHV